jgi:tetrahydromethanopterin S-methyltransferase subunit G
MSEENTQNMLDGRSFEERVFARFDAMDARFDGIEKRLESLETQAEKRALETKPIWERALAEILEVKGSLANLERKIDVLSRDIIQVRADQAHVEDRLDKIESKPMQ